MSIRLLLILFLAFSSQVCHSQPVPPLKLDELQSMLHKSGDNDTIYLFSFWNTMERMTQTQIERMKFIERKYQGQKVKIVHVSLDSKKDVIPRVTPFIYRTKISGPVYWLDTEGDTAWSTKLDEQWNGDLPATIIVFAKAGEMQLVDQNTSLTELDHGIQALLKKNL